ncbi:MAG TPA: FtsH protease activity modulator HflK [Prosthecobacter sp.]|nr:FtsH protease activity modulator HflK [Prosthecobacter sp.]
MAQQHPPSLPFPESFRFRLNFRLIWIGLAALFLLIGLFTSFYQVPASSVGVVQRFGKYLETTEPGLNFKLPYGFDTVTLVETRRQLKLEFGYGSHGATNDHQYSADYEEQEMEKNMVTGDLNAAVVEWVVQFHIGDARAYVFNFLEPQATLRALSEAVMREVVGDRSIDEVLTVGRQEIEIKALERLQQIANGLQMGVFVDQIQLGNVNPPAQVKDSFDEVNRAQQEKESMINQANGEYNRSIPRARGEAEQRVSEAEGYATKRVNEAEGDAARFSALLAEYQKAPAVTKQRMYLETLGEILPAIPGKTIVDESLQQFLPLMHLQQKSAQPAPKLSPPTR